MKGHHLQPRAGMPRNMRSRTRKRLRSRVVKHHQSAQELQSHQLMPLLIPQPRKRERGKTNHETESFELRTLATLGTGGCGKPVTYLQGRAYIAETAEVSRFIKTLNHLVSQLSTYKVGNTVVNTVLILACPRVFLTVFKFEPDFRLAAVTLGNVAAKELYA